MRNFLVVLGILAVVVIAGCGGGGGGGTSPSNALATSADGKITLTGAANAAPNGVTLTVDRDASISGAAVVGAVTVGPINTTFASPVTMTFKLSTALPLNTEVRLYWLDPSDDTLKDTGKRATISANGLTATVLLDEFDTTSYVLYK